MLLVCCVVASILLSACCGALGATPEPTDTPIPVPSADVQIILLDKSAEFVDIQNKDTYAQDLEGWTLVSEKGNQACSLHGVLEPGEVLRIWALAEDAGEGGLNCGFDANVWNNSEQDPAVLYDLAGEVISRFEDQQAD
jgi:hypothetical protein